MFPPDESDSEPDAESDLDFERRAQRDLAAVKFIDVSDIEDEELSDMEIEKQQEELYRREQAQILLAERHSDPDWLPDHLNKKRKAIENGDEHDHAGILYVFNEFVNYF